jgi:acetoin utilization deacetylase AcuC-like enzyme
MTVAIISHADCSAYDLGPHHPECSSRISAISDQLLASGLDFVLQHHDAPLASNEQLCRVHDPDYIQQIFHKAPRDGQIWLDPDTPMTPQSLNAALRAAGAVVHGVDLVMSKKSSSAFCNVRPPGHHAEHNKAMGFCIFNNIAVGAAHALHAHQLQRVAIVDFDVHHGNGTEDIFRHDPQLLLCSSFQHPFYPNTGSESDSDNIINMPLSAGSNGTDFRNTWQEHGLPALDEFKPELILISAGFDGHIEDDMARLRLTEDDYAWLTTEVKKLAEQHAQGRIVSTLEGGYALSALGRSVSAHVRALLE